MGRKKVCSKTLRVSGTQRKETFGKRTRGLFKKAHELAAMCGCAIHLVVVGEDGRTFQLHRHRNPTLNSLSNNVGAGGVGSGGMGGCRLRRSKAPSTTNSNPFGFRSIPSTPTHSNDFCVTPSSSTTASPSEVFNPTPIGRTQRLWCYNPATTKMEDSGFDSVLTDHQLSRCPIVDPCADCRLGNSRFVGRESAIDENYDAKTAAIFTYRESTEVAALSSIYNSSRLEHNDNLLCGPRDAEAPASFPHQNEASCTDGSKTSSDQLIGQDNSFYGIDQAYHNNVEEHNNLYGGFMEDVPPPAHNFYTKLPESALVAPTDLISPANIDSLLFDISEWPGVEDCKL